MLLLSQLRFLGGTYSARERYISVSGVLTDCGIAKAGKQSRQWIDLLEWVISKKVENAAGFNAILV